VKRKTSIERFKDKCEFQPGSGCVLWQGATAANSAGDTRSPRFRDGGKVWAARKWAAVHIHGLEVGEGMIVVNSCGEDRCVQHVSAIVPGFNVRQHWLLTDYGYLEREPEESREASRPRHDGPAIHEVPEWLK